MIDIEKMKTDINEVEVIKTVAPTRREKQVWYLVSLGLSNTAIAEVIKVTPKTVERFMSNLFNKKGSEIDTVMYSKRVWLALNYKED